MSENTHAEDRPDPTSGTTEPTLDEVERELRLVRARERALELAETAAMRETLPARVDRPTSAVPYLGATGIGGAAMLAAVFALGLPAATVATYGLTFLALGMGLKRMEDVPPDHPNALLRWAGDRMERLGEKFGVETYGLMALTTFLHYEVASLSVPAVPLAELFVDFPGNLIVYFVQEIIETVMNMVWAGLWWIPLFTEAGWAIALSVIAAAWAVVWMLDLPVDEEEVGAAPED
jgi:hypothetical protein